MNNIIKVENLSYSYPDGTQALNNISLEIKKGEKVAIMGANGSGKSTFFLHLNGVIKANSGKIIVDGLELDGNKKSLIEARKKVGIIFQNPDDQLFASNLRQEISFGPLNLSLDEETVKKKVDEIIDKFSLNEIEYKPTHFLSGGQKKKVAVADIMVMEPEIIIFDEPAAALDPKHIKMLDEIIFELSSEEKTVLVSTHDVDRALKWADRIILFREGKIIGDGKPDDIFCDTKLLEATNLEMPAVIKFYKSLVNVGVLEDIKIIPKNLDELESQIERAFSKCNFK